VQDAYVRLAAARESEATGSIRHPLSYLYRIVRNLAFDRLRRDKVEAREEGEAQWWMLPVDAGTPEDMAASTQMIARVEAVLARMEPRMRLALELNRFEGHTLQEIAGRLGISVATAHRLVRDAVVRIALALESGNGESGEGEK